MNAIKWIFRNWDSTAAFLAHIVLIIVLPTQGILPWILPNGLIYLIPVIAIGALVREGIQHSKKS